MLQQASLIFLFILIVMVAYSLIQPLLSKNKSEIWSPLTIIALCFIYYVIVPSLNDISLYGANQAPHQYVFYLSCDVFFGIILYMLKKRTKYKPSFVKWNNYFNPNNAQRIAVILFIIALVCYVPFRGFRTTISASDATITANRTGVVSYLIDLISLFVAASCLAFIGMKSSKGLGIKKRAIVIGILYFTLVMFIVGGFRYRLVILIIALATCYHLYPKSRIINYWVWIPVAVVMYLGFAVMDKARSYGKGIDLDTAKMITFDDAKKGAGENLDVCCFSIAATDYCSRNNFHVYFEPLVTAILMPIPRAIFPEKPSGEYLRNMNIWILGTSEAGAAVLVVTEAYMMFGLIGVILYAWFIGWFCRKVWDNYRYHPKSIGAILLLALLNGLCYDWISRGYMGGLFNDFIYFVVLPFWITALVSRYKGIE